MLAGQIPIFDDASSSSSFPSLWLHPLHNSSGGSAPTALASISPESTTPCSLINFAIEEATTYASTRKKRSGKSSQSILTHNITLGNKGLLVADLKNEHTQVFDIPLLFSEVVSCQLDFPDVADSKIIAVGRRQKIMSQPGMEDKVGIGGLFGSVWIIIVEGGDVALQCALTCMSSAGAIRSDLHDAYDVGKEPLGSGGYSTVYLARARTPKTPTSSDRIGIGVAVKLFTANETQDISILVASEAALLLSSQRHPNIIGFHGIFSFIQDSVVRWALNLEWCPAGDLHDELAARGPCSEGQGAEILFGVLSGLAHIHARMLVHRDVKAENVLMMECGRPVLSDFGIASRLDDEERMKKLCGSPGYVAPEVLGEKPCSTKIDVFSTGVLLYFALSATLPFVGPDIRSILRQTVKCHLKFASCHFKQLSVHMKKTLILLMQKNPNDRLSSIEALQHTWALYAVYLREHAVWLETTNPTPMEVSLSSLSRQRTEVQRTTGNTIKSSSSERSSYHKQEPQSSSTATGTSSTSTPCTGDASFLSPESCPSEGVDTQLPTLLQSSDSSKQKSLKKGRSLLKGADEDSCKANEPTKLPQLQVEDSSKEMPTNLEDEGSKEKPANPEEASSKENPDNLKEGSSKENLEEHQERQASKEAESRAESRDDQSHVHTRDMDILSESHASIGGASSSSNMEPQLPQGRKPSWSRKHAVKAPGTPEASPSAGIDIMSDPIMFGDSGRRFPKFLKLENTTTPLIGNRLPCYQFATSNSPSQPETSKTKPRRLFRPLNQAVNAGLGTLRSIVKPKTAESPRQSFNNEDREERRNWESWTSEASQRISNMSTSRRSLGQSEFDEDEIEGTRLTFQEPIMEDMIMSEFKEVESHIMEEHGGFGSHIRPAATQEEQPKPKSFLGMIRTLGGRRSWKSGRRSFPANPPADADEEGTGKPAYDIFDAEMQG